MQETMPVCALIDKEVVYHTAQMMWDATQMVNFIEEPHEGKTYTQAVPYPMNDILIFFEYWKREALYDKKIASPLIEFVGLNFPRFYDSYLKELIGTQLGVKTAGRNIILLIYVPIFSAILYVLNLILRLSCKLFCSK